MASDEDDGKISGLDERRVGYGTLSRKVDALTDIVRQLMERKEDWNKQVSFF